MHTAQEFWDPAYRTVRSLMPRWRLFPLMTPLTPFLLFESVDPMMEWILSQGEVRYRLIPDTRSLVLADDTSTVVNEWRPSRVLALPVPPARGRVIRQSEIRHDKAVAPPPFLSSVPDHCPGTSSLRLFSSLRIVDPNTLAPHSPGTIPSSGSRFDKVFYRENETLPLFARYVELLIACLPA